MEFHYFKINENTTLADINFQRRELSKKHHPDKGGDTKAMQEINQEYQQAVDLVNRQFQNQDKTEIIDIIHSHVNNMSDDIIAKINIPDDFKNVAKNLAGLGLNRLSDFFKVKINGQS